VDDDLRPAPPRRLSSEFASWVEWFGVARLVTSACAVVIVCLGGWWLIRSPTPPVESSLPRTTASGAAPTTVPSVTVAVAGERSASAEAGSEPVVVVVHVAGAVVEPGVYRFEAGARVADAVERAGGATVDGRPHLLNLAGPLVDGMRVRVPVQGEPVDPALARDVPVSTVVGAGAEQIAVVDVNVATVSELDALPGVGLATAAAIVAERERNGPFVNVSDLERVPGIGPAKLAAISELVTT